MTVAFVGLSHLGIVSSIAAASKGLDVVGFDPDPSRCEPLSRGQLPLVEPQLPQLLAASFARLRFTSDPASLRGCELIVCSADVPTLPDDRSDLSRINQLLETVIEQAAPGSVLIVLSQVPPGFTRALAQRVAGPSPTGRELHVFYQVETLIFGRAVERAVHPERFIVGCRDPQEALPACYARWLSLFGCPILQMRYESAELAKISINMFLASSVCVTNTLAELCEAIGADWSEIIPALTSDGRIGPLAYVRPGLGLAGGNLERDLATVTALAQERGTEAGIVEAWRADSRYRRDWALRVLHAEVLWRVRQPRLAVWGLAYKPGTDSIKHSAAIELLESLRPFAVQAYDPHVALNGRFPHVTQTASALEACRGADALVIMTAHPEFAEVPMAQVRELMRGETVVDPFGVLPAGRYGRLGLRPRRLGAAVEASAC